MKEIEIAPNYAVDVDGKIYNRKTGNALAQRLNRDGYLVVELWKENKKTVYTVHRFVAKAFIPNPDNLPCVNHKDGNKANNKVENLEWVTYSQNTIHAFELGLMKAKQGEDVHNSVLTEEQVHKICQLMEKGYRNIDIYEITGVEKHLLKNIRNHGCWPHIRDQYNIPKKSRVVSENTVKWICEMIVNGMRNMEIVKEADNPKVTKSLVSQIKRRVAYSEISKNYNF